MKNKRALILKNLKATILNVVSSGGRCIFASADIYEYHRKFLEDIFIEAYGFAPKVWTLKNDYNPVAENACTLRFYDDRKSDKTPAGIYADTVSAIEAGRKVIIQATSQKVSSPYGTKTLEADLKKRFSNLKILRWDSETNNDPFHPSFGFAEKRAENPKVIEEYDVIIISPVGETGVSIDDPNGHFDLNVFIGNSGDQDTRAIKQTIRRLRSPVERWVYVAPRTTRRIGGGMTSPRGLIRDTHKGVLTLKAQLMAVGGADDADEFDLGDDNKQLLFLKPWAMSAALKNLDFANYRDRAREALEEVGYRITRTQDGESLAFSVGYEAKGKELKEVRDNNETAFFEAVDAAPTPTDERWEILQEKTDRTESERLEEAKGFLNRAYGVEPTYPLIKKHYKDSSWLQKLKLHYHLTDGKDFLTEKEKRRLESLMQDTGTAFAPEVVERSRLLKIYWLKQFGIERFLSGSSNFSEGAFTDGELTEEALNAWYLTVIERERELKRNLGISIWSKTKDGYQLVKPKTLADRLLALVDMCLTKVRRRVGGGERVNSYRISRAAKAKEHNLLPLKADIFQAWLEAEKESPESEEHHPPLSGDQKFSYNYTNNTGIFGHPSQEPSEPEANNQDVDSSSPVGENDTKTTNGSEPSHQTTEGDQKFPYNDHSNTGILGQASQAGEQFIAEFDPQKMEQYAETRNSETNHLTSTASPTGGEFLAQFDPQKIKRDDVVRYRDKSGELQEAIVWENGLVCDYPQEGLYSSLRLEDGSFLKRREVESVKPEFLDTA